MKSSLKLLALAAGLTVMATGVGVSLAVDKDQVIKDRAALMKQQGADMGAVKSFLDDKNDLAKATAAASDLVETMRKIPDTFPPGTEGPSPDNKYAPKPEVWSNWNGFLAARDAAAARATALQDAVKTGDKAAIQTAFADLGKNGCGACHQNFRVEIK